MVSHETDPFTGKKLKNLKEFKRSTDRLAGMAALRRAQLTPQKPNRIQELRTIMLDKTARMMRIAHERDAAEALRFNPNAPVTEQVIDQGHQPQDTREARKLRPGRPFEAKLPLPGPISGESEGEIQPDGREDYERLTRETIEASAEPLAETKELLHRELSSGKID